MRGGELMFKLSNETYNVLKWVIMIVMPSLSTFIGAVGFEVGIANPDTVVNILNALTVMLGAWIGTSSYQYSKGEKHE